jgi:phosphatidylglycerol:prolipoprotein diacylglycerol transferase
MKGILYMQLIIDPVAFSLGPITLTWYGLIIGIGALCGLLLVIQEGKRYGLSADFFMDLLLLGLPSAIIGARIYYVAFQWDEYKTNLIKVFYIWEGGIAIYGALIGALICGYFYTRYKGYRFARIVDICAPALIVGQMIGRWGNFVNQEAYGGPVAESFLRETLHLPNWIVEQMFINGEFHHPTFLYESFWNLLVLILLLVLRRMKFMRAGEMALTYFAAYSVGRFFIEQLRTDSLAFQGPDWLASMINTMWFPMRELFGAGAFESGALDQAYGNIRVSQLIALVLFFVCIMIMIIRRAMGFAHERYSDPIVSFKTGLTPVEERAQRAAIEVQDEHKRKQKKSHNSSEKS